MRFGWVVAAAALVCAGEAGAASYVVSGQLEDSYVGLIGPNAFSPFDPEQGILTSVDVTVEYSLLIALGAGGYNETPTDAYPSPVATTFTNATAYVSLGSGFVFQLPDQRHEVNCYFCQADINVSDRQTKHLEGTDLAGYIGNVNTRGFVSAPLNALGFDREDAEFVNFRADGWEAKAFYSITYNYDAALPEPATWAMMMLGFAAAGSALRRRRQLTAITLL